MRERLLARMPQPENLTGYRKETAALLAKHEKALFWEKMPSTACYVSALVLIMADTFWGQKFDAVRTHIHFIGFWAGAGVLYFVGAITDLRYRIYRSKVDTLKEVKQVQLQILELQESLTTAHEKQP